MPLHTCALWPEPRKKKYLIESKLGFELARCKVDTFAEYWNKLTHDETGAMERRMMNCLTTNYTFFCREEEHFDFIGKRLIPDLPLGRAKTFRAWSAGCATGQECYTLAMLLSDCRSSGALKVPFSILGTDLSETAIATAQKGIYGSADYARLPHSWQMLYCGGFREGQFRVSESLQHSVRFERQNLVEPSAVFSTYDLIFCRNLLIYFREQERIELIAKLTDALVPGGYLMIGHTETLLSIPNSLNYIGPAIYRKPGVGA